MSELLFIPNLPLGLSRGWATHFKFALRRDPIGLDVGESTGKHVESYGINRRNGGRLAGESDNIFQLITALSAVYQPENTGSATMANFREIHDFQKDAGRSRRLAESLLMNCVAEWSDWERDFLDHMQNQKSELSTRQAEKLLELRNDAAVFRKVDGIAFTTLIRTCFEARLDLDDEDDGAFLEKLRWGDAARLRRPQALRLVRIARRLGLIEPYAGGTFSS